MSHRAVGALVVGCMFESDRRQELPQSASKLPRSHFRPEFLLWVLWDGCQYGLSQLACFEVL